MSTNTVTKFWRRPPPPTWRDLRALSLLAPAVAATLGGIAYSLQGIAATQAGAIPPAWARLATEYGAVLLAIGCEGGTLSALAEIARKRRDGDAGPVDKWAGWVSFAATVFARLLALADLRALWSIALLVLLSSADIYALLQEAGEYLALHDRNMERWLTALAEQYGVADLVEEWDKSGGDHRQACAIRNTYPGGLKPESAS